MKLWKKTLLMFSALVLLSVGTVFAYAAIVVKSATSTLKSTYTETGNATKTLRATEPLTIVLAGVDTGGVGRGDATSWQGNTDSQIVLTLNPKTETATMISMERDIPTNILDQNGVSTGSIQKMNAAFQMGYNNGGDLSTAAGYLMQTISNQAGIPIDKFMLMNFDGLINLVNDVGGVNVVNDTNGVDALQGTNSGNITLPVTYESVASGAIYISDTEPAYTAHVPYYSDNRQQTINGDQALVFARDRHTLPNGDYGRAAHQRLVLQQLVKKILSMNNLSQYQKFLTDVSKDFKTNIPVDMNSIQALLSYKDCFKKVVSIQYQGIGGTFQDASYEFMPENANLAIQNAMRLSVGKSPISSLDSKVITYESQYGTAPGSYYLPSATITEGSKITVMGVNPDGSFVNITSDNSNNYVSTNGGAVQTTDTTSSSGSSSASSSN